MFRVLMLGDIVGRPGRRAVSRDLPEMARRFEPDLVVANAENASGGLGLTRQTAKELLDLGIDVLTSGNHIWKHSDLTEYLDQTEQIVRPANYPHPAPGRGLTIVSTRRGHKVAVANLLGRVFMEPVDCPFQTAEDIFSALDQEIKIRLVDFHAEATSEKQALGWFLDGRVSLVAGTHTHVQTADAWILPGGTAFISDLGMCGPVQSILGMDTEAMLQRLLTARPVRFAVADGPAGLNGVYAEIDDQTGLAQNIVAVRTRPA